MGREEKKAQRKWPPFCGEEGSKILSFGDGGRGVREDKENRKFRSATVETRKESTGKKQDCLIQ